MGRGYWVNRWFFSTATGCVNSVLPEHTQIPPPLTEYMALTMREAVDTLPESSSKLWVSLFIVSTLMSGLPRVTPRRPGSKTRQGWSQLTAVFSQAAGASSEGEPRRHGGEEGGGCLIPSGLPRLIWFWDEHFNLNPLNKLKKKQLKSSTEHADLVFVVCKRTVVCMTHCLCAASRR